MDNIQFKKKSIKNLRHKENEGSLDEGSILAECPEDKKLNIPVKIRKVAVGISACTLNEFPEHDSKPSLNTDKQTNKDSTFNIM